MTFAPQESHVSPPPDILPPAFVADPYGAYRTMRASAPLIHHEATDSYLASRYEDVERVFKDKAGEFTTATYDWQIEPVHGRTILQFSGREHVPRRALVAPALPAPTSRRSSCRSSNATLTPVATGSPDPGARHLPRDPFDAWFAVERSRSGYPPTGRSAVGEGAWLPSRYAAGATTASERRIRRGRPSHRRRHRRTCPTLGRHHPYDPRSSSE